MSQAPPALVQEPPREVSGILRRLGPGMIIAASIVGSGELIGTTKTGAQAGFWLLWLIVVGCLIKVFAQIEFGRYAIAGGKATIPALDEVPGPRWRVSWLLWYWLFMFLLGLGQLGGIVGSVGQTMALSFPLTGDFLAAIDRPPGSTTAPGYTWDDVYWSAGITALTAVLLINGRYNLIQNVAAVLVAGFTSVTILNLVALQSYPQWHVSWADLLDGFRFRLPPSVENKSPVITALATFGIIGVGASELIAYPYWCLEKGYARFTGPPTPDAAWSQRARGWLRVMQYDAWCSMVIYTFATVAFYLLGAAVLWRAGLDPGGMQLVNTLRRMYEPVFGGMSSHVFLVGAFAVLYSTFFVATAGNARMAADAVRVFRLGGATEPARRWWIRAFCGVFPFLSLAIYLVSKDPALLVLASGMAQSVMLPMLGGAALYFRYRRCDARIAPGKLWDTLLWVSVVGLLLAGVAGTGLLIAKLLGVSL